MRCWVFTLAFLFLIFGCFCTSDVIVLDESTFNKRVSEGDWLLDLYAPWCGHCKQLEPILEQVATQLKEDTSIKVGKIDCTSNKNLAKRFNINSFPTVYFLKNSNVTSTQLYTFAESKRDVTSLVDYVKSNYQKSKSIPLPAEIVPPSAPKLASDPPPSKDANAKSDVIVLTASNFTNSISTGTWFIEFYAPWCGHCKRLAPVWEELATDLNKKGIKVGKIDANSEENKKLGRIFDVKGYPTLKFFKDGKYRDYSGERTVDVLKQFATSSYDSSEAKDIPSYGIVMDLVDNYLGWIERVSEPYAPFIMEHITLVIIGMTMFGLIVGFLVGRASAYAPPPRREQQTKVTQQPQTKVTQQPQTTKAKETADKAKNKKDTKKSK